MIRRISIQIYFTKPHKHYKMRSLHSNKYILSYYNQTIPYGSISNQTSIKPSNLEDFYLKFSIQRDIRDITGFGIQNLQKPVIGTVNTYDTRQCIDLCDTTKECNGITAIDYIKDKPYKICGLKKYVQGAQIILNDAYTNWVKPEPKDRLGKGWFYPDLPLENLNQFRLKDTTECKQFCELNSNNCKSYTFNNNTCSFYKNDFGEFVVYPLENRLDIPVEFIKIQNREYGLLKKTIDKDFLQIPYGPSNLYNFFRKQQTQEDYFFVINDLGNNKYEFIYVPETIVNNYKGKHWYITYDGLLYNHETQLYVYFTPVKYDTYYIMQLTVSPNKPLSKFNITIDRPLDYYREDIILNRCSLHDTITDKPYFDSQLRSACMSNPDRELLIESYSRKYPNSPHTLNYINQIKDTTIRSKALSNIRDYCSDNGLEDFEVCKPYCNQYALEPCDIKIKTHCDNVINKENFNFLTTLLSDTEEVRERKQKLDNLCGCFMSQEFYVNYTNNMVKEFSKYGIPASVFLASDKDCIYPRCTKSEFQVSKKTPEQTKKCAAITTCTQSFEVDIKGNVKGPTLEIDQIAACFQDQDTPSDITPTPQPEDTSDLNRICVGHYLTKQVCIDYCNKSDKNCDDRIQSYCLSIPDVMNSQYSSNDTKQLCSDYMSSSFYNNIQKSIEKEYKNLSSKSYCYYTNTNKSQIKRKSRKTEDCKPDSVCFVYRDVDKDGNIVSYIDLQQKSACLGIEKVKKDDKDKTDIEDKTEDNTEDSKKDYTWYVIGGIVALVVIVLVVLIVYSNNKKNV